MGYDAGAVSATHGRPNLIVRAWRALSVQRPIAPLTAWRVERKWAAAGRPLPPPPILKQALVRRLQRESGLRLFIETGTFTGEMLWAVRRDFSRLVSIELDPALASAARARLSRHPHVTILQGDTVDLLPGVLSGRAEPALFWLDAHYTGGVSAGAGQLAPILEEIAIINAARRPGDIVLIDDARCFNGEQGFPKLEQIRRLCASLGGRFEVVDDVIRWDLTSAR